MEKAIIKRIDELIKLKGWSKYELAKNMGISPHTIYRWYQSSTPSLSNIEKICEILNITIEQFFYGVGSCKLDDEQKEFLKDWFILSDLEKQAIFNIIDVFKKLKSQT